MAKLSRKIPIDLKQVQQVLRKFPINKYGYTPIILVVAVIVVMLLLPRPPIAGLPAEGEHKVLRCVDGDTIILENSAFPGNDQKGYRVRLIGADTPETVHPRIPEQPFGKEASEFTKKMIADSGNLVRIEFDGAEFDKYERVLALVFVKTPGGELMLNEELVREGLARAMVASRSGQVYDFSLEMKQRLLGLEAEARRTKRGIWSLPEEEETRPSL